MQRLKELLLKGEKGDAACFSAKLDVDERTFYRLKKYLNFNNGLSIKFDRTKKVYYLE